MNDSKLSLGIVSVVQNVKHKMFEFSYNMFQRSRTNRYLLLSIRCFKNIEKERKKGENKQPLLNPTGFLKEMEYSYILHILIF